LYSQLAFKLGPEFFSRVGPGSALSYFLYLKNWLRNPVMILSVSGYIWNTKWVFEKFWLFWPKIIILEHFASHISSFKAGIRIGGLIQFLEPKIRFHMSSVSVPEKILDQLEIQ